MRTQTKGRGIEGLTGLYAELSGAFGVALREFRLFILGFVAWNILVGVVLIRLARERSSHTAV